MSQGFSSPHDVPTSAADQPMLDAGSDEHETLSDPTTADPAESARLPRGAEVGRYTILEEIGRGGMGVVYAAFDPQLDRRIALKVLRPSRRHTVADVAGRLLREAQAMARLSHANVITVHDVGTVGGRVFLAMEFVEGITLRQWLDQEPAQSSAGGRTWQEVVEIFVSAGRGLAAAHAAGLVHRDFKPDNVLIGNDGRVLVMDFGLARPSQSGSGAYRTLASSPAAPPFRGARGDLSLTRTGALTGTPAYMAPEQHRGQAIGPLADQFSFCVALYESLYGHRPFAGKSVASVALNVLEGRVREAPRDARVPTWLREVVLRGLRVDPDERYPSIDALLAELQRDPPRRTTPWIWGGMLIGFVGAIASALWIAHTPVDERCENAGQRFDDIWNIQRKDALAAGLGKLEQSGATAKFVASHLDGTRQEWLETWREACKRKVTLPHPMRRAESPVLQCLQYREAQLDAILEILTRPDAAPWGRAVAVLERLPSPRRCLNGGPASAFALPRLSPAERLAFPAALARAQMLRALGDANEAAAELEPLLQSLGRTAPDDWAARLLLLQGQIQTDLEQHEGAEVVLEQAAQRAGRAENAELEVEAWSALAELVGLYRFRTREGLRLLSAAAVALERVAAPDELRGQLLRLRGRLLARAGRFMEAAVAFEQARALAARPLAEPRELERGLDFIRLGAVAESLGRYAIALEYHNQALRELQGMVGPTHPLVGQAWLASARASLGAHDLAAASHALAQARSVLDGGKWHPGLDNATMPVPADSQIAVALASVYDHTGLLRRAEGESEEAGLWHQQALHLLEHHLGPQDSRIAYPLVNLGVVLLDRGKPDEAVPLLQRARDIWKSALDESHPNLAVAHLGLAHAHWAREELEAAHANYVQALAVWEQTLPNDHPLLAHALTGLGRVKLAMGQPEEAVRNLELALALDNAQAEDRRTEGALRLLLAQALWQSGADPNVALDHGVSARNLLGERELEDDEALRVVLSGEDVSPFTDKLMPVGLSVSRRDFPGL